MSAEYSLGRKLEALNRVAMYRPLWALLIVGLSIAAAALEGVGLGFLIPILENLQAGGTVEDPDGILRLFEMVYSTAGVPLTLGYLVAGVTAVMTVRYSLSFLVEWLRAGLRARYVTELRMRALENALDARLGYFDQEGSDEILNTIITESKYAGRTINTLVRLMKEGLLAIVYLAVAWYIAPVLTFAGLALFGGLIYLSRVFVESGYSVGDRVARANERIQRTAQAGTQGIAAVKVFGLEERVHSQFENASEQFTTAKTQVDRNKAAITNGYQLAAAISLFVLIYVSVTVVELTLAEMGVFIFAMFRLAPITNGINETVYTLEQRLPHLIRVQEFIDELEAEREPGGGSRTLAGSLDTVAFDGVSFAYDSSETVLSDISFSFRRDEFIAFVGPSGAGKSTIASLLCRLYEPNDGEIRADGVPIDEVPTEDWRSRVSIVRQQPHIFDTTLAENVSLGRSDATRSEIERACELAQVTEFADTLPDGYDTELGDDGVRLSGGQRQRVAIARALLKEGDIVIMDEATSDLDSSLERQVHEAIAGADNDAALLVIAHRLSTVTDADRIYTVEDGEISESGSHRELIDADGQYAELYGMQAETA